MLSLIAIAKEKASKGSAAAAFKNENGAIDLASIMVGIIVIGLIGGVIAATVFTVIPWSQDNAAKQQLDSVAAAQSAYMGLSIEAGSQTYGGVVIALVTDTTNGVITQKSTVPMTSGPAATPSTRFAVGNDAKVRQSLFSAPDNVKISIGNWGSGSNAHYAAAIKSATGNRFWITDTKTQPTQVGNNLDVSGTSEAAKMGAAVNGVSYTVGQM